jgi:hypothetical protein
VPDLRNRQMIRRLRDHTTIGQGDDGILRKVIPPEVTANLRLEPGFPALERVSRWGLCGIHYRDPVDADRPAGHYRQRQRDRCAPQRRWCLHAPAAVRERIQRYCLAELDGGILYGANLDHGTVALTGLIPDSIYQLYRYTQADSAAEGRVLNVMVNGLAATSAPGSASASSFILGQNYLSADARCRCLRQRF